MPGRPFILAASALQAHSAGDDLCPPDDQSRRLSRPAAGTAMSSSVLSISRTSNGMADAPPTSAADAEFTITTRIAGRDRSVLALPDQLEGVGQASAREPRSRAIPRSRWPCPDPRSRPERMVGGDQSAQGLGGTVDDITKATKSEVGR
jgi:hypothetical protein